MSSRFSNDAIEFDTETDAGSPIVISGVTEAGESLNTSVNAAETGGPYGAEPSIGQVSPVLTFATEQLETIVDNIGLMGKCIDSGVGNPGFTSYWARHDPCGPNGRAATSVHYSNIFGDGHAIIESITANAGQSATVRLQIHGLSSDGETTPIARAWNVALPTWPADDAYTLAGVLFAGNLIETVTSISINYNVQFTKPVTGSFKYPTMFDPLKAVPSVTLTFDDPEEILTNIIDPASQITETGRFFTSTLTKLQFRRTVAASGDATPYSKASSEHLTCAINGLAHVPTPYTAAGSASGTTSVEIICYENTVGVPLIWTKDQAIT
jgi:hypothetical protein